jgi:cis-3-alkyl-4-acyloxetan-2-one decarboxylase
MKTFSAPELPQWLSEMLPFRRYCVELPDGRRMHVMEAGDPSAKAVVMVHGNPTWGFLYRRVAEQLKQEKLRLIMPDLLGLGLSERGLSAGAHTLDNHQRWFASFLRRIDVSEAILAVQDWGGPIAVGALSQLPDLRVGLVVMNTVLGPPKADFRPTAFHRFARLPVVSEVAFKIFGFPQRGLHWAQGDRRSIVGKVAAAYRYPLRRFHERTAPLALARMVPNGLEHPSIEALRHCQDFVEGFRGPATIVWGDRDPVLGRARSWIEKLLPQATVTRTQAGHFIQEEAPLEIAAAIRQVADRLDGKVAA